MTNKFKKSLVIKNVDLSKAFKNFERFYIPIDLDKLYSEKLGARKVSLNFIPKSFIFSSPDDNVSRFEDLYNLSYIKENKPFFVKTSAGNKKTFSLDNIEDSFTQNNLFKKIYAKNIASTYSQQPFVENISPLLFESEDNIQTIFLSIPISKIEETTGTYYRKRVVPRRVDSQSEYRLVSLESPEFSNILIKVYILNENDEIIDYVDIESKSIDQYSDETSNDELDAAVIRSNIIRFADSFDFQFNRYNRPIIENYRNEISIGGPKYDYSRSLLSDTLTNNMEMSRQDLDVKSFRVFAYSGETGKSFRIKNLNQEGTLVFDLQGMTGSESFSFNLIRSSLTENTPYVNFITDLYHYVLNNNLSECTISFMFNLTYDNKTINFVKNKILSLNTLKSAYDDIQSFFFERDIASGTVINASIRRFNSENDVNTIFSKYALTLNIDKEKYSSEDILQSIVNFKFGSLNQRVVGGIERFYFDESLDVNNSIPSKNIALRNILSDVDSVTLFFQKTVNFNSANDVIRNCSIILSHPLVGSGLEIGPFSTRNLLISNSRQNRNIYDSCATAIGNVTSIRIKPTSNVRDSFRNILVDNRFGSLDVSINGSSLVNNSSLRQLGYFSDSEVNNSIERLRSLLSNTIVKVNKKLILNGIEINTVSDCFLLEEISTSGEIFKYSIDLSNTKSLTNFNVASTIQSSLARQDYQNFMSQNYSDLSRFFDLSVSIGLNYYVLENQTAIYFGDSSDNQSVDTSKTNLADSIFAHYQNQNTREFSLFLQKMYSESYFEEKSILLSQIFYMSQLDSLNNTTYSINTSRDILFSEEGLEGESQLSQSQSEGVFIINPNSVYDFNVSNIDVLKSNLILDYDDNGLIIDRQTTNSKSNDFSIEDEKVLKLFSDNPDILIIDAFLNTEFLFDINHVSLLQPSNREYILNRSEEDNSGIYVTNPDRNEAVDLAVIINQNSIEMSVLENNFQFAKFNQQYYQFVASQTSGNNIFVKDLILRVCIILDIDGTQSSLVKSFRIAMSDNLINYATSVSYNNIKESLNIDIANQNLDIYMPNVFFKG